MGRGSMLTGKNRWVCKIVVVVVVVVVAVTFCFASFMYTSVGSILSPLEMALFPVLLERERVLPAHQL